MIGEPIKITGKPALRITLVRPLQGLGAGDFGGEDMAFLQSRLRILCGLFGVLRPLDAIEPYRLEMGTKFAVGGAKNLYDFWRDTIVGHINRSGPTHLAQVAPWCRRPRWRGLLSSGASRGLAQRCWACRAASWMRCRRRSALW